MAPANMPLDTGGDMVMNPQDEATFWDMARLSDQAEDINHSEDFMRESTALQNRLIALDTEKRELEQRVLDVRQSMATVYEGLEQVTRKFHDTRRVRYAEREAASQKRRDYFNACRKRDAENRVRKAVVALANSRARVEPADLSQSNKMGDREDSNGMSAIIADGEPSGKSPAPPPRPPPPISEAITIIINASNARVGPVYPIHIDRNRASVLNKPAQRAVQLRPGVIMTQSDLQRLHDNHYRWTSTMTQAVGTLQTEGRRCSLCLRGEGPFAHCVTVGGLNACGNCQWEGKKTCTTSSVTTPVPLSRPVSREKSMETVSNTTEDVSGQDLAPITRESLVFKHNDNVYTHPECLEGVPLERIDPTHPYWDPSWPEITPKIQEELSSWEKKLDTAMQSGIMTMKFQFGRQVNRGGHIKHFLTDGDFHPYQLLSKKYMTPKIANYDTLYRLADTIGTLKKCKTLDITPMEWLRHRLHEIIVESGSNFSLSKTIHDFYHDPKYEALRTANSMKSIGRPPGMKTPKDSARSGKSTPNPAKRRKLSSDEDSPGCSPYQSIVQTPTPTRTPKHARIGDSERSAPSSPNFGRAMKKPKGRLSAHKDVDLAYDGFTDTDEFSGDKIGNHDWQLNRIKSRLNTVGTGVTQYWHWIPDTDEAVFEHQVLAEGDGAQWGIYASPINFHLELEHIHEIMWAPSTNKVYVMCKPGVVVSPENQPRGDLIAEFKRRRTKLRFLSFCRKKNVRLLKTETQDIERAWDEYESPDVPTMADSEIS